MKWVGLIGTIDLGKEFWDYIIGKRSRFLGDIWKKMLSTLQARGQLVLEMCVRFAKTETVGSNTKI